jgi:hypothetical protein
LKTKELNFKVAVVVDEVVEEVVEEVVGVVVVADVDL